MDDLRFWILKFFVLSKSARISGGSRAAETEAWIKLGSSPFDLEAF
jgi:hypothetical protein